MPVFRPDARPSKDFGAGWRFEGKIILLCLTFFNTVRLLQPFMGWSKFRCPLSGCTGSLAADHHAV
ncbi:hypothetical protein, partial [Mesorhizobium sp.]|uniref:hypothetical protein n=1 Tax=Mesorhizobium sp. TaxID=1871066 RepID=UPI0025B93712